MSPVVFHSVHVASLVLRPVDVLREHLKRPPWERGPVRPVPLVVMGRVTVGGIDPLPAGTLRGPQMAS